MESSSILPRIPDSDRVERPKLESAVAAFSNWHDGDDVAPFQAKYFKKLIPLNHPKEGEQFAFEVNLDQCTGCKSCVAACHSLNGLDDDESWRDVGTIISLEPARPYLQTVTSACHHCEDPACANGCPVLAYEKDASTGIVRHLDDQCIGCSYCILKCPYDVPKFNKTKGIVRKCDMCHDRLAEGEAPACVQACPNEAISIRIVEQASALKSERLLPGTFDSNYTLPTTRFVSKRPIPEEARYADAGQLRLDHAHSPLAWMLVLTQWGVGAQVFGVLAPLSHLERTVVAAAATILIVTGIGLSTLHLGQPLKAWRAFLGWRKSWLSREILTFGLLAQTALLAPITGILTNGGWPLPFTLALSAAVGIAAIGCSIMVYVDTRRPFWSAGRVSWQFLSTASLLGSATVALFVPLTGILTAATGVSMLLSDYRWMTKALREAASSLHTSARILIKPLKKTTVLRWSLLGASILLSLSGSALASTLLLAGSLVFCCASSVIDRHQFFTACNGPRMPEN